MKTKYISVVLIILVGGLAATVFVLSHTTKVPAIPGTQSVSYQCAAGKTFTATFTESNVSLVLSDGRTLTLTQAMSGSGVRYEQGGVSFIGKGSDGFIEEDGVQTYANCIANAAPSKAVDIGIQSNLNTFSDTGKTFSLVYPPEFTVSGGGIGYTESWMNGATTTGLVLAKFTLPKSFQPNTNFSEATLTVGTSADPAAVRDCLSDMNGMSVSKKNVTIHGTEYAMFVESDAGAGNLYQTTSYHTERNSQCYVIEYTVHSTNIGNYSLDQGIHEFDHSAVEAALDTVVQSFTFL